jgi:hypothetical protein
VPSNQRLPLLDGSFLAVDPPGGRVNSFPRPRWTIDDDENKKSEKSLAE